MHVECAEFGLTSEIVVTELHQMILSSIARAPTSGNVSQDTVNMAHAMNFSGSVEQLQPEEQSRGGLYRRKVLFFFFYACSLTFHRTLNNICLRNHLLLV